MLVRPPAAGGGFGPSPPRVRSAWGFPGAPSRLGSPLPCRFAGGERAWTRPLGLCRMLFLHLWRRRRQVFFLRSHGEPLCPVSRQQTDPGVFTRRPWPRGISKPHLCSVEPDGLQRCVEPSHLCPQGTGPVASLLLPFGEAGLAAGAESVPRFGVGRVGAELLPPSLRRGLAHATPSRPALLLLRELRVRDPTSFKDVGLSGLSAASRGTFGVLCL